MNITLLLMTIKINNSNNKSNKMKNINILLQKKIKERDAENMRNFIDITQKLCA